MTTKNVQGGIIEVLAKGTGGAEMAKKLSANPVSATITEAWLKANKESHDAETLKGGKVKLTKGGKPFLVAYAFKGEECSVYFNRIKWSEPYVDGKPVTATAARLAICKAFVPERCAKSGDGYVLLKGVKAPEFVQVIATCFAVNGLEVEQPKTTTKPVNKKAKKAASARA